MLIGYFFIAAIAEILGCYSFYAWLRLNKSFLYIIPGSISLLLFAYFLSIIDLESAGRAYAAYGGIYIISSIAWMYFFEKIPPNKWDLTGGALCLGGAIIIIIGSSKFFK